MGLQSSAVKEKFVRTDVAVINGIEVLAVLYRPRTTSLCSIASFVSSINSCATSGSSSKFRARSPRPVSKHPKYSEWKGTGLGSSNVVSSDGSEWNTLAEKLVPDRGSSLSLSNSGSLPCLLTSTWIPSHRRVVRVRNAFGGNVEKSIIEVSSLGATCILTRASSLSGEMLTTAPK